MGYNLKQYTYKTYRQLAEEFDIYFTKDNFKTSADNSFRDRYEVLMPQIDHWINSLNLGLDNIGTNDGSKFKSGLFVALEQFGWSRSKIPGRWQKYIYK
jgi:hypothetical protein